MVKDKVRILITILGVWFTTAAFGQVQAEFNKYTVPLHQDSSFLQFSFLDTKLQHVDILALGENSHGTHEFFTSKFEIIKYCILKLNYKVIGIEADYAGTELANEYIAKGKGSAMTAVYNMGISAWMTEEMRDILNWLKEYNQNSRDEDKIRLFGFDMQFQAIALSQLKSTLIPLGFGSIKSVDTMLAWTTAKQVDSKLLERLSTEVLSFAGKQDGPTQTKLEGLMRATTKSFQYLILNDPYERLNFRDKCMYENIMNVYQTNTYKTIIWAHNEHVAKQGNIKTWNTMGQLLYKNLGVKYYAMGLITTAGKVGFVNRFTRTRDSLAIPTDTKKSAEAFFASNGSSYFYVDMQQAITNSPVLTKHFNTLTETFTIDLTVDMQKQHYTVTKTYFKNKVMNKFDGILFIRTTTASRH